MDEKQKDELIQRAKAIEDAKMRQHEREREELDHASRMLSDFNGNRKARRALAAMKGNAT
jgi:hypothetical protein